jgi:hypothetical protein
MTSPRAVWSFWSRPFQAYKGRIWASPLHHLLAWGLSVHAARRHYAETVLVTDEAGRRLLVDRLGLPFAHVSTDLERLRAADPSWWALGKLVAYSLQDRPFLHLDSDVFLWQPLPAGVAEAPVFAQCPEYYHGVDEDCSPRDIEAAFAAEGLALPAPWEWARSKGGGTFREENCGVVGGTHVAFLRRYAETALDVVLNPAHAPAWARLPIKEGYSMIIEQFMLAACVEYHRFHPSSPYRGVRIAHLFRSWDEAFDAARAARAGFTHLIGGAKSSPAVARRLEARLQREDPGFQRRCERALEAAG